MIKTEPTTAKQWYQALEDALDGPARTWRDHVVLTEPGMSYLAMARLPKATQVSFETYYRYIRGELFRRVGLRYTHPGERIKRSWEDLKFPGHQVPGRH